MNQFQNNSFIQINPLLYFINEPALVGWIYERFVNILMYDGIVDYVDNVNYSGLFLHVRSYALNELENFDKTINYSVSFDRFAVLWVDEFFIPQSYRYGQNHFVHPLIVYDYDKEADNYGVIFFDIMKVQVFISISAEKLNAAVSGVKDYYMIGGNISAVEKTLSVFRPYSCLKGDFHLDVFIRNLSYYLYCTYDAGAEWYNLQRKELFHNRNVIYGVQIYMALINELKMPECRINYKTIHDFVNHKRFLYEKLLYIENEYNVSQTLKRLIERFCKHAEELERIRLLNMKYQIKNSNFPASLCFDPDFKSKLICVLARGYDTELEIIPKILCELRLLTYTKSFLANHHIVQRNVSLHKFREEYCVERFLFDKPLYSSRIDIVREIEKAITGENTVIINGEYRYSVNKAIVNHGRVHSVNIPVTPIYKIECISSEMIDYTLNIICLPGQDTSKPTFEPELLREYDGTNQMAILGDVNDAVRFQFLGNDPYVFKTGFAIAASVYRYLRIDMKTADICGKAQVFFSEVGREIWSVKRMVEFDIIPDGKFHTYIVDMARNENWAGFIGGIRLDPAHYDSSYVWSENLSGECTISSFTFCSACEGL